MNRDKTIDHYWTCKFGSNKNEKAKKMLTFGGNQAKQKNKNKKTPIWSNHWAAWVPASFIRGVQPPTDIFQPLRLLLCHRGGQVRV